MVEVPTESVDKLREIGEYSPLLGLLVAIVLVLGAVIVFLYRESGKIRKQNQELNEWTRGHAEQSVKVLSDFSNLLDKIMDNAKSSEAVIGSKIEQESDLIKNHVSLEVEKLKSRV